MSSSLRRASIEALEVTLGRELSTRELDAFHAADLLIRLAEMEFQGMFAGIVSGNFEGAWACQQRCEAARDAMKALSEDMSR